MKKLLTSSNSVILIVALVLIVGLLMPIAEAEITPGVGIEVETYYENPHGCDFNNVGDVGECINSFDHGRKGQLYYTTGKKMLVEVPGSDPTLTCLLGFKVYTYDGDMFEIIYEDENVYGFSGGRIKRYGKCMLFNDGGTANYVRMSFDYYIFDPRAKPIVVNKLYDSTQDPYYNLWGLSTRHGTELWAAGNPLPPPLGFDDNEIFYSKIDFNDNGYNNHCGIGYSDGNPPIISIGDVGAGGTGPLAFDSRGNLYYAQGWNGVAFPIPAFNPSLIYRFSAREVRKAINHPDKKPLEITDPNEVDPHVWETISLSEAIGVSSMVFVEDIGLVLTTTSFHDTSQLRLYTINPDDSSGGWTVLATSSGRMSEIRYRFGKIFFNDPHGIYYIDVTQLPDDED